MMSQNNLDRVVNELRRMIKQSTNKSGVFQSGPLVDSLINKTKLDTASLRILFKEMRQKGWIEASSWSATGSPVGRVVVKLPALPAPSWCEPWDSALLACKELSEDDRKTLFECGAALFDMDSMEFPKVLSGLVRLRADQSTLFGKPQFLVSAKYLFGSSKLLSSLPGRAIKAFGIEIERFTTHPRYVVAGGCTNPDLVILVENPAAFELAMSTNATKRCAFVATFGFGLSKQGEDYGYQLADMVKSGFNEAITLIREGSDCPPANVLLTHQNIAFWGDLDIAGMQIFERIAADVPQIQLSALYKPMIDAIQGTERRHPYVMAAGSGKPGQKMFQSSRQDIQKMLNYCERYAVDQEIVLPEEIKLLAGQTLDISDLGEITPTLIV